MPPISRLEAQRLLAEFCARNAAYRDAFVSDPRRVLEAQFRTTLPADLDVRVLVEDPRTRYVIVPYAAVASGELSDDDLEAVAGGAKSKGDENCEGAVLGTVVEISVSLF